jgi:hypothetical protein
MKTGSRVFIKVGTKLFIGETSSSISTTTTMIPVSSKISGRGSNKEYGRIETSISVSGIEDTTPDAQKLNFKDMYDIIAAATKPAILLTSYTDATAATEVVSDVYFSGTGLISDANAEYPDDSQSTMSCTIQIDGLLTTGVNT